MYPFPFPSEISSSLVVTHFSTSMIALGLLLAPTMALAALNEVSYYPTRDAIPSSNAPWIHSFLQGKTIPGAPRGQGAASDWEKDIRGCADPNTWALTFDDGPSANTQFALDALNRHQIKGTFFVTGTQALANPEMLLKTHQAGHQIGIHTFSHSYLTSLTNEQIIAELVWTAKIIKDITGVTPTVFRPPYGDVDERVRFIARELNLKVIIWNKDSNDFKLSNWNVQTQGPVPSTIVDQFRTWVSNGSPRVGSISLQHDLSPVPAGQIGPVLDVISKSGYKFTKMDECIGTPAYDESIWTKIQMERHDGTTWKNSKHPTWTQHSWTTTATTTTSTITTTTSHSAQNTGRVTYKPQDESIYSSAPASLASSLATLVFAGACAIVLF